MRTKTHLTEEEKNQAILMYKSKRYLVSEIANLLGYSITFLRKELFIKCFEDGTLTPRSEKIALKPRPLTRKPPLKYVSNGRPHASKTAWSRRKIQGEQEQALLHEYYELGFTAKEIMYKYSITPKQLQNIRRHYQDLYQGKRVGFAKGENGYILQRKKEKQL